MPEKNRSHSHVPNLDIFHISVDVLTSMPSMPSSGRISNILHQALKLSEFDFTTSKNISPLGFEPLLVYREADSLPLHYRAFAYYLRKYLFYAENIVFPMFLVTGACGL